jgi:hypothetical protein
MLITAVLLTPLMSLDAADLPLKKPNVFVFLADDAGWGDYGASGNTTLRTPHIDSIARGGVTFDPGRSVMDVRRLTLTLLP